MSGEQNMKPAPHNAVSLRYGIVIIISSEGIGELRVGLCEVRCIRDRF